MIEVENIDFLLPRLAPKLRYINQHVENLKTCRAVRALRQTRTFIQSRPFIFLFLAFSIAFGFLPFIVFGAFVGGSLFVILFAALTAMAGVCFVAFGCLLTVLFPVLITAASVGLFIYVPYCLAMKIQRFLKRFGNTVMSHASRLQESFRFADYQEKVLFSGENERDFAPATEEICEEQYVDHSNAIPYLNRTENQRSRNREGHWCKMREEDYVYNRYGPENYLYKSNDSLRF